MHHTKSRVVEQPVEGHAKSFPTHKRLTHAGKMAHMGQQALYHIYLPGFPGVSKQRLANAEGEMTIWRQDQTRVQAALTDRTWNNLVVGSRSLQFVGAVKFADGNYSAVGQLPEARNPFVRRMVMFKILAFDCFLSLTAPEKPLVSDADSDLTALAHQKPVALGAHGLVNKKRGGSPAGHVEGCLVQRLYNTVKCLLLAHCVSLHSRKENGLLGPALIRFRRSYGHLIAGITWVGISTVIPGAAPG